jgi:protein-disulfide isomerase
MTPLTVPVGPEDHILGPSDARITLVQYGSYDCQHCLQALTVLNELFRRLDKALRYVYRHLPQETLHSVSFRAAEAAEAAAAQGKFWEMHTHLLENQHALDDADLIVYASVIGLDATRIAAELETDKYAIRVHEHLRSGVDSGVVSTPTFFINGLRHDDYWDVDTLMAAILEADLYHEQRTAAVA